MENVYLYVHDLRSSGVVRDAITYARRLSRDHPTTLVAGYAQGFFAREAALGDVRLQTLAPAAGPMPRLAAAARLHRWLLREPPGVLVSLGNLGHSAAYLATRRLDHIRRVYRISNEVARGDGWRGTLRRRWMRMLIGDAERIILVGRALGRNGLFAQALAEGRAVEIASSVDLAHATAMASQPAPHPWLVDDPAVILGIGRLRPQKNFDLLIDAVALARQTARLRLAIIGGGTRAEQLRLSRRACNAGLADDFLLAGETANVFAWLARARVFVLPSRWEGSSLALLEALAVGTPVAASRLAGDAAHVLDEGRYGALFDGTCAAALADVILAQASPGATLPGNRAEAYSETLVTELYAQLIGQVLRDCGSRSNIGSSAPSVDAVYST